MPALSYALLVHAAPYSSQGSLSALRFANALIEQGHLLRTVFFYHDGVLNASKLMAPPQDEVNLLKSWEALNEKHQTELLVCIAAALRRGIVNEQEMQRHSLEAANLSAHFELTGLGQLVDAMQSHDRVITFAP